jgi:hypothetical protein
MHCFGLLGLIIPMIDGVYKSQREENKGQNYHAAKFKSFGTAVRNQNCPIGGI